MKKTTNVLATAATLCVVVLMNGIAKADTQITDFNTFFENELYASWLDPASIIDSGPQSYNVTATGYGSNYTYIGDRGIVGTGNTHLELDVTLIGPPEADGILGPIITLIDADGSKANFAWYGQLLGHNILTMPVTAPPIFPFGTIPGLDLNTLTHMHMQLDSSTFAGQYTVQWNNLRLITVAGTPGDFDNDSDVDGRDFLAWQRGGSPVPLSAADLTAWQNGYGGGPLVATSAVPEPSSVCVMILASISAIGFRRPSRPVA